MVLVDTSVWIRFQAGKEPYVTELGRLLALKQVAGHDLVYGKLLIGDKGGCRDLLTTYQQMYQAPMVDHREVVGLVHSRGLQGRGANWIGVHLLASALRHHLQLWTADPRLAALAEELGTNYSIPQLNSSSIERPPQDR